MNQPETGPQDQSNLDDRRWALLSYLFTPVVPALLLLREDIRTRPYIKAHLAQAMALGVLQLALLILAPFTFCLTAIAFLLLYCALIYWGIMAYNGQYNRIPWVTDYVTKQGWA
jgi:uncharacterized membrane protein